MTHGFGAMPDYAAQIPPRDRWCIVAYIRALQLSQGATQADVPQGSSSRLCRRCSVGTRDPERPNPNWSARLRKTKKENSRNEHGALEYIGADGAARDSGRFSRVPSS